MTDEGRIVESGPIPLSAEGDVTANPTLERSSAEGKQTFSIEQSKQEVKAADAAHRREEQRKDNELRRHREKVLFYVVVAVMAIGLVAGFLVGTFADNADTRRFGQGLVVIIFGAVAGYFTGRAAK